VFGLLWSARFLVGHVEPALDHIGRGNAVAKYRCAKDGLWVGRLPDHYVCRRTGLDSAETEALEKSCPARVATVL